MLGNSEAIMVVNESWSIRRSGKEKRGNTFLKMSNFEQRAGTEEHTLFVLRLGSLEHDRERCLHAYSKEASSQNFNPRRPSFRALQLSVLPVRGATLRCCSPASCQHSWAPTCVRLSALRAIMCLGRFARMKTRCNQSPTPIHSRHIVRRAAMITGPRKRPTIPNDCIPPKIPMSTNRNGSRTAPPISAG